MSVEPIAGVSSSQPVNYVAADPQPVPSDEPSGIRADPVQAAPASEPASAASTPEELRAHALLAQDVYADSPNPPDGYRVATEADLRALNLDPSLLASGDFRARVYATGEGANTEYVVSFRGSQSWGDWVSNVQQGVGVDSAHYRAALAIGERIGRSDLAGQVSFTGHSLGGGLASAAAVASGRPADTFNAAGLHGDTIDDANAIRTANGTTTSAQVDAWYVESEILSALQDGGDRIIGGTVGRVLGGLLGPFGGLAGGLGGAAVADMPEAYGTRHALDASAPDGKNWFDRINPADRHGMDWVLSSLPD